VDKSTVRERLLAARRGRSPGEIASARAAIREHVLARLTPTVRCVAAYQPLRTEPGSIELLDALAAGDRSVLLPVRRADNDLDWVFRDAPDRSLGIDAVAAADLILVPALAVDRRGVRLGRGGGSYDRALARVGPGVAIVALVYADEVMDALPSDSWDRPVSAVVTPTGWVGFE
jgi:5-formyltetrahydrofolate cyclo-ligase